jgi:hypothetical protein
MVPTIHDLAPVANLQGMPGKTSDFMYNVYVKTKKEKRRKKYSAPGSMVS